MSLIEKLTPEQEALIPVYREKWRAIALSTERIDREKAAKAVKVAYAAFGFEEPDIIFCDSPYAAFSEIFLDKIDQLRRKFDFSNIIKLNKSFRIRIKNQQQFHQPVPRIIGKQINFYNELIKSPIFQEIVDITTYDCLYWKLDSNGWDDGYRLFYGYLMPELLIEINEELLNKFWNLSH